MIEKIFIIDFEDSFTFNIASEVRISSSIYPEVIPFSRAENFLKNYNPSEKNFVILGPGPGHPNDYLEFLPWIKNLIDVPFFRLMGLCLGHQLIWASKGASVISSRRPLHGERIPLKLDVFWQGFLSSKESIYVQRYNSLTVDWESIPKNLRGNTKTIFFDQELMGTYCKSFVSYQFHPESIGTTNSQAFFKSILCNNIK